MISISVMPQTHHEHGQLDQQRGKIARKLEIRLVLA